MLSNSRADRVRIKFSCTPPTTTVRRLTYRGAESTRHVILFGEVKNVAARLPKEHSKKAKSELIKETLGGHPYEYYPLGEYVVAARGVCGGRPTIKYHRLDARHIIGRLRAADSVQDVARNYRISTAAVNEAIELASVYDYEKSYV